MPTPLHPHHQPHARLPPMLISAPVAATAAAASASAITASASANAAASLAQQPAKPAPSTPSPDQLAAIGQTIDDKSEMNNTTGDTSSSPSIIVGRRQRKKPRIFETTPSPFARKPIIVSPQLSTGTGLKLLSIPNIAYSLDKVNQKDSILELLHRVLYNSQGPTSKRKTNIRVFSGFSSAKTYRANGDAVTDRTRAREKLLKVHYNIVRRIANILDIPMPQVIRTVWFRTKPSHSSSDDHKPTHNNTEGDDVDGGSGGDTGDDGETEADVDEQDHVNKMEGEDQPVPPSTQPEPHEQRPSQDAPPSPSTQKSNYAALRDEQRKMKETVIEAILNFLDCPAVLPGRINLAQRDKEQRAKRRAMGRERAKNNRQGERHDTDGENRPSKKLKTKDASNDSASTARGGKGKKGGKVESALQNNDLEVDVAGKPMPRKTTGESDEDGDEDLEREALPWIELMQQDNRTLCSLSSSSSGDQDGETVAEEHV